MSDFADLPLFPLHTVLFPGMVLPLRVFEDRYKTMINYCLEEERPFGVLLIREGKEVGESAVPYEVGTTTVIASVSHLADGQMSIVTIGSGRFRLRTLRKDGQYLRGDADPWPLAVVSADQAQAQVDPLHLLLAGYLERLEKAQGHQIEIDSTPTDPRALALLVAISLQVRQTEKQRLLIQPTVAHLIAEERTILRREHRILDYIIQTQQNQWEGGHSGLLARN